MFGWFKRPRPIEETDALEKRQQMVEHMSAYLDRWVTLSLGPSRQLLLGRLKEAIIDCLGSPDAPPVTLAKKSYMEFLASLDGYRNELGARTKDAMKPCFDIATRLQLENDFRHLIEARLAKYIADLKKAGLSVLAERTDVLKSADEHWRTQYPEKAVQFPLDQ